MHLMIHCRLKQPNTSLGADSDNHVNILTKQSSSKSKVSSQPRHCYSIMKVLDH